MMDCKKERLLSEIDRRKDELFSLLGELIRINSENFGAHGNEQECAEAIGELFQKMGMPAEVYSPDSVDGIRENPDYLPGRNLGSRPNCTAAYGGTTVGGGGKKLMLAAHLDTTPIGDPAKWSFPPLCGEVRDGRILGRGACDDKYGIAAAIFLMKLMAELEISLPYTLLFTAYSDEEYGGGNGTLAACLKYPCDDYLNLDCKDYEVWDCGVGGGNLRADIRSKNPVDTCAAVADGLMVLKREFAKFGLRRTAELEQEECYRGTIIPQTAMRLMELKAGNAGADLDTGHLEYTYYTTKTEPEIGAELDALRAAAAPELDALGLEIADIYRTTRFFHFMKSEGSTLPERLVRAAAEAEAPKPVQCGASLSDLSLFIKYGSPTAVSFGVGRDFSVYGGAHQTDEYVECDNLWHFTRILSLFLLDYGEE